MLCQALEVQRDLQPGQCAVLPGAPSALIFLYFLSFSVCVFVYMCVYVCVSVYLYICECISVYIYMWVYMCI